MNIQTIRLIISDTLVVRQVNNAWFVVSASPLKSRTKVLTTNLFTQSLLVGWTTRGILPAFGGRVVPKKQAGGNFYPTPPTPPTL